MPLTDAYMLITSATRLEASPFLASHPLNNTTEQGMFSFSLQGQPCSFLVTGVGVPLTLSKLWRHAASKPPALLVNIGIAGSYLPEIQPGAVVQVDEDAYGDLGLGRGDDFLTLYEARLADPDEKPFTHGKLKNPAPALIDGVKRVKGLTVNSSSGNMQTARKRHEKFRADIETMESAAVFQFCLEKSIPFLALRSVSNYAGETDKSKWKIDEAVENLNQVLHVYLELLLNN